MELQSCSGVESRHAADNPTERVVGPRLPVKRPSVVSRLDPAYRWQEGAAPCFPPPAGTSRPQPEQRPACNSEALKCANRELQVNR